MVCTGYDDLDACARVRVAVGNGETRGERPRQLSRQFVCYQSPSPLYYQWLPSRESSLSYGSLVTQVEGGKGGQSELSCGSPSTPDQ